MHFVPRPTGEQHFEEIAMNLVGELPESKGFNTIVVVTDQFTKVQHYILPKTSHSANDITNAYIKDIWKLYGLLTHVTSDRSPQFASKFFKELNQKLNIHLCLSTACQLQTDGVIEQAVQTVKQYLHIYYHDRQNCW